MPATTTTSSSSQFSVNPHAHSIFSEPFGDRRLPGEFKLCRRDLDSALATAEPYPSCSEDFHALPEESTRKEGVFFLFLILRGE